MAKKIIYGTEARQKLLSGVEQVAKAVTITLGPKGRNVALDKKWIEPQVIHDGVTVAREIDLPDFDENIGARLVRQASSKTNDKAGDGTTTSMLLAWKMIAQGMQHLEKGVNPMTMKKGIMAATDIAIEELKKISIPVQTKEQITQVASVSSADKELGTMIGEAMEKVGKEGVITVEEGAGLSTTIEYKEGMEFDKGYISAYFSTNDEKMEAESESPYILITDQVISDAQALAAFLKRFVEETNRQEIVFIASNIEGAALGTLLINKERGGIKPLGIFAPGFAERRKDILEDIAILTGGTVIARDKGMKLENVKVDQLGRADRIWCDGEKTKIIGGMGSAEAIASRAQQIRELIAKTDSDFEKDKLKERLARLTSGAAIIKVGAMTEVELKERKERVIDAVEATKSAVEEGIVAGGGITPYWLAKNVAEGKNQAVNDHVKAGMDIVYQALLSPLNKILENAGIDSKEIIAQIEVANKKNYGYDVETEEYGDLIEKGIVDPTKVTRNAIQNAASVASLILTTEATVTDIEEEKKKEE